MRSIEQINAMLIKARDMLLRISIPISSSVNPSVRIVKGYNFYGRCHRFGTFDRGSYDFEIQLPEHAFRHSDRCLMNTLLHELIHTAPECFNHGQAFKGYGARVMCAYGYDIAATGGDTSEEDREILSSEISRHRGSGIVVKCVGCGRTWRRYRECRLTRHPEYYRCNVCHCEIRRVDDTEVPAPSVGSVPGTAIQLSLF